MKKTILLSQVFLITALFSISACAETPSSAVTQIAPNGSLDSGEPHGDSNGHLDNNDQDEMVTLAVKYLGRDTQGRTCDLYVSIPKEDHAGHEHAHKHALLIKVDYTTLDGHRPHAGEAQFYLYNSNTGVYYDEDSNQAETTLALLSVSLKNPNATPDPNSINDYLTQAELEQYLRVEFKQDTDAFTYEQALHEVLDGGSSLNDNLNVFNSVQFISMATAHGDHYHFPACMNYKPVSIEETTFNLHGHEEEEDDHDHDHDHDHGHSH